MLRRVLVLCAVASPCLVQAGVSEGVDAYTSGRFVEARRELAHPAEEGDAQAMVYMGEMLMRGFGGARDELKARDYITRSHAAENIRATYLLGTMHLSGNLVVRDEARGVELIRRAADKGEAAAQNTMGAWLANGARGYAKDEGNALAWFKLAADQKNAAAMGWIGNFTEEGKAGIAQDYLVALDWYKKAGDLGNAASMSAAGRMYAVGRGVSADGAEALRWLRRAAAVNYYDAFQWIASVYELGRGGVAKNPALAYAWYGAVPANADARVVKNVADGKERLTKTLSAGELQEAEKQAKSVAATNTLNIITARLAGKPGASTAPRAGIYGSGVVVSDAGDIVTNEHVINNCARIRIQPLGIAVKLVAKDARNDLALLRAESADLMPVKLRAGRNVRLGDDIIAIGYPLKGVLSSGAVVTTGIVNAMSGMNDDTSAFQISATVQPGSSGGPIFDRSGNLVGIVRARLLSTTQANPQNVNFGINLATVSNFLDTHSVNYPTAQVSVKPAETADLVEHARKSTVQVECY
ncbi:MAG TPA: tetratricopeptide repeat-containing serine protease family protein [Burkholderiales bacterium]|nr:tetratricopeptide repeat-containing serine protease family protein [Burkholderiales bacterium]